MSESPKMKSELKPLVIGGSVTIENPLVLAPLAGHTDRAFRGLVRALGGCGVVITEMVSSEGLTRGSGFSKELAEISRDERPVGVQIFGCDPERMGDAAAMVEDMGADFVDVNMGCPVPKVTRNGSGAALMKDAPRAGEVIARMVSRTTIPVTAKIRSGWDQNSINAPDVARVLEESGAAAITVHPRCRSERHRGEAAWPVIADVKEAVSIPVIGNGDVRGPDSARRMVEETHVDGIMIGRGALMNPWVFRQIVENDETPVTLDDYRKLFESFIERLRAFLPDRLVVNRMKAFLGWVTKGLHGGHTLRQKLYASKSIGEMENILEAYFVSTDPRRP